MKYDGGYLKKIAESFDIGDTVVNVEKIGNGNINSSFKVTCEKRNYFLQKINTAVFKNPEMLSENIITVCKYQRELVLSRGGDPEREAMNPIMTLGGNSIYEHSGEFWRMFKFVEGSVSYDSTTPELFEKAGNAFGCFQRDFDKFDAAMLHETIAYFHDTAHRYEVFCEAAENDTAERAASARNEIAFIKERKEVCSLIVDELKSGAIPLRISHNDTKLNNILFDEKNGDTLTIVDLDTVMPGSLLYDFGDAIRFGASTASEEETDLSKVSFDINMFKRFAAGYLGGIGDGITDREIELLPISVLVMALELGIRFLTDYLMGDVYFGAKHPAYNLERARVQLTLCADIEKKLEEMSVVIAEIVSWRKSSGKCI